MKAHKLEYNFIIKSIADIRKETEAGKFKLPPVQRDAVWGERNVEMLWDSILREYPIGIFICAEGKTEKGASMPVSDRQQSAGHPRVAEFTVLNDGDYILIDGQQRMDAISDAFLKDDPFISVWFDMSNPIKDEEDEDTPAVKFQFFVCTRANPWGVGVKTYEQETATVKINYQENDNPPPLKNTWPLKARLPIRFIDLLELIERIPNKQSYTFDDFRPLLPQYGNWNASLLRPDIGEIIDTIQQVILKDRKALPFIILKEYDKTGLGAIYDRINTGGMPPGRAEMFFSALKLSWPDSKTLVSQIYSDPKVGQVLKPLDIVLLAVRTVSPTIVELDVKRFDGFMNRNRNNLRPLLLREEHSRSPLHQYMVWAREALEYNGIPGDPGMPPLMLAALNPRVWQTLVYWIAHHPGPMAKQDRMEMLRYTYFDLFFHNQETGMDKNLRSLPFLKVEDAKTGKVLFGIADAQSFPGRKIYQSICKEYADRAGSSQKKNNDILFSPEEFQKMMQTAADQPVTDILANEFNLILWAQRESIYMWAHRNRKETDVTAYWSPTRNRLDVDHILPATYLTFRGSSYWWNQCAERYQPNWIRNRVLHSIGNKRYWPSKLNRAGQDQNLDEKFLFGDASESVQNTEYGEMCLYTISDVRKSSAFPEDDESLILWKKAAALRTDHRDWSSERRFHAFYQATCRRRYLLYQSLFDAIGWQHWMG